MYKYIQIYTKYTQKYKQRSIHSSKVLRRKYIHVQTQLTTGKEIEPNLLRELPKTTKTDADIESELQKTIKTQTDTDTQLTKAKKKKRMAKIQTHQRRTERQT